MSSFKNDEIRSEVIRLNDVESRRDIPAGFMRFTLRAQSKHHAKTVIDKTVGLLKAVDKGALEPNWPPLDYWNRSLPSWFIGACEPCKGQTEALRWLSWFNALSESKQRDVESKQKWSLPDFLYWFEPQNRHWYWWNAQLISEGFAEIGVIARSWPFPVGSLKWILRASGANDISDIIGT